MGKGALQGNPGAGSSLRHWRQLRGLSQLDLALEAGISTRHLSCVETGKAGLSRETLHLLLETLDVPLRERNALFVAAGFAGPYRDGGLPASGPVRRMLDLTLGRHEPFPALVTDSAWDIVMANAASRRLMGMLLPDDLMGLQPLNHMRLIFDPRGLRRALVNWPEVSAALTTRMHREAIAAGPDSAPARLMAEILRQPDAPTRWRLAELEAQLDPLIELHFRHGGVELRLFTTLATVGTPQDVALQELRIEAFHPADEASEAILKGLADAAR